jgi:hypothetical protein
MVACGDLYKLKSDPMSSEYIVEPSKIESQLNLIWDLLRGKGKTRASLFNLVIYTEKNSRVDYLYKVAQKLIERFPSRILFVTIDGSLPPHTLKTSVSAIASESSQSSVACDLINIVLSQDNKERAPFMLLPHLLTDLPTYLLWGDDPAKKDPISSQIEKLATRVIFDSECTEDLCDFARALLFHKTTCNRDIADLNWARTEGWRQLFAETFKNKEQLESLEKTTKIEIVYNRHPTEFFSHTKIQALYLQGWIANQMHWSFSEAKKSPEATEIIYKKPQGLLHISLKECYETALPPGGIVQIILQTANQEVWHFERSKTFPHIVEIKYTTPLFCRVGSQFILERYESGVTLVKEIFHKGTSAHFLSLMQTLSQINNQEFSQ